MQLQTLTTWLLLANSVLSSPPAQNPILSSSPTTISSHTTSSLLSLHKSLVEIESITLNEHAVAQFLTSYLRSHNFTVELQPVDTPPFASSSTSTKPRENILAYLGSKRQTRILVSSHIDTVPPYWPYKRIDDEIWGRGSVDAKGSVAAQITSVLDLISQGEIEEGDVGLLFVVGEETGGEGMRKANDLSLSWETVIFGEPTELKLASGHKGIMGISLQAKGKAGHSGYPELGRSANKMLIEVLGELLKVELPRSGKFGNTTVNVGRIEGGVAANVIAEDASALLAIRIAGGEPEDIREVVREIVADKGGEGMEVSFSQGYGPVNIDCDVPGFETIVVNYGTDIPNLKGDHKRYLYGPGTILMAHSDHEHLHVADLEAAVKGYKALIEHSLK